jgi:hypothetical protein
MSPGSTETRGSLVFPSDSDDGLTAKRLAGGFAVGRPSSFPAWLKIGLRFSRSVRA